MTYINQSKSEPLPLFYSAVEALDRDKHRKLRLNSLDAPFSFARGANMLPAVLAEFRSASVDLPILFFNNGQEISPFFLVGLRSGSNVFVSDSGDWSGRHVPAYLRRYPFIGAATDGDQQVICFDPASKALQSSDGEKFFGDDGAPTPTLGRVMDFVNQYVAAARETQEMTRDIAALDLFKKVDIDIRTPNGHTASFHGFLAIDEEKFDSLGDDDFMLLRSKRYIAGIYAHLASLSNISGVGERYDKIQPETAAA